MEYLAKTNNDLTMTHAVWECGGCGALVVNTAAHDRWHYEVADIVREAHSAYRRTRADALGSVEL